jgi:RNA polymerase sigma-70 factor (ECF subfamily)
MGSNSSRRSLGTLRLVTPLAEGHAPLGRRPKVDDESLVAAIREGRPDVASDLCDRLWPQVDRTVRRLMGRFDSDQEDLAQIALIEIVNTIGNYRGDCSLDRWAQTVTAHAVFKHLRRRNLERRLFSELLADDVHAGPVQVERTSASRQLLGRIAGHLDLMNADRVWAFLLHDVLGHDLLEIAEMTGTTVAAAQSRLSRGRRELHLRVADDPELAHLLSGLEQKAGARRGASEPEVDASADADRDRTRDDGHPADGDGSGDGDPEGEDPEGEDP